MRRRLSPASLLVVRLLLIANGCLTAAVGLISALFVERPAGLVFAVLIWVLAGTLFGCVRMTDPYRHR